jgi:hypothetical protein
MNSHPPCRCAQAKEVGLRIQISARKGYRFHLDLHPKGQRDDLHRRTCRRVRRKELSVDSVHSLEVPEVGHENRHLDDPVAVAKFNQAEQGLVGAMGKMSFVMEAYPELKANENMMQLTEELTTTENRIAFARQAFNDFVLSFNTYRQSFPQNQIAGMFGFTTDAKMLEFEDSKAMQAAPKVDF